MEGGRWKWKVQRDTGVLTTGKVGANVRTLSHRCRALKRDPAFREEGQRLQKVSRPETKIINECIT